MCYYLSITAYCTPFIALIPELGHSQAERLTISTAISLIFIVGTAMAYVALVVWGLLEPSMGRVTAMRVTFILLAVIAFVCMQVPVFVIRETDYVNFQSAEGTAFSSLVKTFRNKEFCIFVGSDIFYWIGLTMFQTGFLFFVTSLLDLPESMSTVYRYFSNKETIILECGKWFWTMVYEFMEEWSGTSEFQMQCGLEQVESLIRRAFTFYREHRDGFRMIHNLDGFLLSYKANLERLLEYERAVDAMGPCLCDAIEKGKRDGSISGSIETQELYYAVTTGIMSAMQKQAAAIRIPVLLFQTGRDTFVRAKEQELFLSRIPKGRKIRVDSRHEIKRVPDDRLEPYLAEIFAFCR